MIREKKARIQIPSNSKINYCFFNFIHRKVSSSASVEAALVVPLFLVAIVTLIYFYELVAVQTSVRMGLQYAEKAVAEKGYTSRMISPGKIEQYVISEVGQERIERSIIDGSISCKKSYISPLTGTGKLEAAYRVRIPVPFLSLHSKELKETMMCKLWCGFEKGGFPKDDEEIVYIAENGVVYHLDYNCTYLDLSIKPMSAASLDTTRNASGGIYHACEYCHPSKNGLVYVTTYGDCYHSSLSCSGLKRTVYSVPKSEAIGKGACSKCAR